MSTLKLKGSTSGYVELTAPATAGDNTITLPTDSGTVVVGDGSGNVNVSGIITATSFSGDGSGLTGVGIGTDGSVNTTGIITATSFSGSGSALTGVGKILQVVYAENGTSTSTTSSTYQDTNVTATITPTSASSKILIVLGLHLSTVSANAYPQFLIKRNSTSIYTSGEVMYVDTISQYRVTHGITYLDSPSTTSATTYTIGVRSAFGTTTVEVNRGAKSTITLMEVAA
jgi:hypothetical protein